MEHTTKIIIRLDAGNYYGLGHLSRCISLIQAFDFKLYLFLIKTDNSSLVSTFLSSNFEKDHSISFINPDIETDAEIDFINQNYNLGDFLIIDHYAADELYQEALFKRGIHWLQLDSHAKVSFYADYVLHGSPGASVSMYEPLRKHSRTKFLVGAEYAIIKREVLEIDNFRKPREELKTIVICFGGGDDRGATLSCLKQLDFNTLNDIKIFVSISPFNKDFEEVEEYNKLGKIEIIDRSTLHLKMGASDLAIVAPGMISYEAAYLGLPMLLITIADNQMINAKAFESLGCAIHLGSIKEIKDQVRLSLERLLKYPEELSEMSRKCMRTIDGKGVKRIAEIIKKEV